MEIKRFTVLILPVKWQQKQPSELRDVPPIEPALAFQNVTLSNFLELVFLATTTIGRQQQHQAGNN